MKTTKIYLMLMVAGFFATANAETFTGFITDTLCGPSHAMMKNHPADQCVRMCAKGQYSYAVFDGSNVIKLSAPKDARKIRSSEGEDHRQIRQQDEHD